MKLLFIILLLFITNADTKKAINRFELHHKSQLPRQLSVAPQVQTTSAGQVFYLAFINSHSNINDTSSSENLTLSINNPSTTVSAQITITSSFAGFVTINVNVPAQRSAIVSISPASIQTNYGNVVLNNTVKESKGVFVQSNSSVTIVAGNEHSDAGSGDTFTVFPTCQLGMMYETVNDESQLQTTRIYTIVATQDNTNVTFNTPDTIPTITTMTLNRLETVTYTTNNYRLTLSKVNADKPIAVFSGSVCGLGYAFTGSCDHMVVQLIDTTRWGSVYPLTPFAFTQQSEFVLLAMVNNTQIYDDGVPLVLMQEYNYLILIYSGALITANTSVDVIQVGGRVNTSLGDPFLVHVPAVDKQLLTESVQFNTGFATLDQSIVSHFVRITTALNNIGQLRIDDYVPSALLYIRAGRGTWYYYEMAIANGTHRITPLRAGVGYTAVVYGYGAGMGYGFVPAIDLPGTNC